MWKMMVNQFSTKDDVEDVERGGAKDGARSAGVKIRRRLRLSCLLPWLARPPPPLRPPQHHLLLAALQQGQVPPPARQQLGRLPSEEGRGEAAGPQGQGAALLPRLDCHKPPHQWSCCAHEFIFNFKYFNAKNSTSCASGSHGCKGHFYW